MFLIFEKKHVFAFLVMLQNKKQRLNIVSGIEVSDRSGTSDDEENFEKSHSLPAESFKRSSFNRTKGRRTPKAREAAEDATLFVGEAPSCITNDPSISVSSQTDDHAADSQPTAGNAQSKFHRATAHVVTEARFLFK